MKEATEKQIEILKTIKSWRSENDEYPTFAEIAKKHGMKPNGAFEHCKALEKKGYITTTSSKSRSIRLTEKAESL